MLSDASLYSEHRSLQVRDTDLFLKTVIRRMDWSKMDYDVVMDLGCGPGSSTVHMILPAMSRIQKLVAVDILPEMIEFAKEHNAHEKVEYHVADIEDRSTIEKWAGQISKVICIHCFNWLKDHRRAFENLHHVMKPGGEAALYFIMTTPFWDSYEEHIQNPKWNKYLKDAELHIPESHFKKYTASYYRDLLQDIGFEIILCQDEEGTHAYPDDNNCKVAAFSRCALTSYIPDELKEDFKEALFEGFLKHNGRNPEGKPVLNYTALKLLIRKAQ